MQAYLITHVATAQRRELDATQWGLSPEGERQAAQLASEPFWGAVTQVVVSAEAKTLLSVAGVVAGRGLPVWVDSRLDELRRSGWVEDYGARVAQVFAQPKVAQGSWESADSALARMIGAMQAIERRFGDAVVAVVGHGLTLSLLRAYWLGYAHVRYDEWARLGFGAVAAVELPGGQILQDFAFTSASRRG